MDIDTTTRIPQTHRTIIFDFFNEQAPSLDGFLDYHSDADSDNELLQDVRKLEVFSFKEFVEKFSPKIYQTFQPGPDGRPFFSYSLKHSDQAIEVDITNHKYYEMLETLYKKKGESGQTDFEFDAAEILRSLTPEDEIGKIRNTRRQLELCAEKYREKTKKGETGEKEMRHFDSLLKETSNRLLKIPLSIVSTCIDDANRQLEEIDCRIKPAIGSAGGQAALPVGGVMDYDATGRLIYKTLESGVHEDQALPAKVEKTDASQSSVDKEEIREGILKCLSRDFDKVTKGKNKELKELMLRAYVPTHASYGLQLANMNADQLVAQRARIENNKKQYLEIYAQAMQAFIDELCKLAQKMLDVRVFFDHALNSDDKEERLSAGVIIANCKPQDLLANKVRKAFESLMETLGADPVKKVWFGVLPHVQTEPEEAPRKTDTAVKRDIFDEREEETIELDQQPYLSLDNARTLLEILDKAAITTFFSFAPSQSKSFADLSARSIEEKKKELAMLETNSHAVYAYPNFTLMGKRVLNLDESTTGRKEKVDILVPVVQVDAAYVAAGLVVASQQPDRLRELGFGYNRFIRGNPMVRVDLEKDEIVNRLLTHFNCERSDNWKKDVTEAINKDSFGFVFSGDKRYDEDKKAYLSNSYIYSARTMRKKQGIYQPLGNTLMWDFLLTYFNAAPTTDESIGEFMNREVNVWKTQAQSDSATPSKKDRVLNLVLLPTDTIQADEREKDALIIDFGKGPEKRTLKLKEKNS